MSDNQSPTVWIWVFNGEGARFPCGIFNSRELATAWIEGKELTGVLTAYPLDEGTYDWAIRESFFRPKSEKHLSPSFIQQFTCASQEHYHFERGHLK